MFTSKTLANIRQDASKDLQIFSDTIETSNWEFSDFRKNFDTPYIPHTAR